MADNRNAEGKTLLADGVVRRAVLGGDFGPATRHEDEDAKGAVAGVTAGALERKPDGGRRG